MPLPLNQNTNRVGISRHPFGQASAYAVPFESNMASSAGSPIRVTAPERPRPRRNVRRDKALTDILGPSSQKRLRADDTYDKAFESESRVLKFPHRFFDHRL